MKIRTRLLLVFVSLTFILLPGFVYIIAEEIRPRYLEAQEEALFDFAEVLATMVSENAVEQTSQTRARIATPLLERTFSVIPAREFDARIFEFRKTRIDIRIYVTDHQGIVLFDSDNGRDVGQDYSRWRDVHYTLRGQYGARASWHDPIYPSGLTLYIARPVMSNGDIIGVLVVGKPTRNAEILMESLKTNLWLTGVVMALVAVLIALILNLWLTRPLARLQAFATQIGRGERATAPRLGNNEVGDVGRALQSMRSALDGKHYIENYIQTLTHELKAPIAGIRGAAELLGEPLPDDKRQRFLDNITRQTDRLQSLVDRLLELARLENVDELSREDPVSLQLVIEESITACQDIARARSVAIDSAPTTLMIRGDAFLLQQAITNLVKNAIEHSAEGAHVELHVRYDGATLALEVMNRGKPIPAFARDRIFDKFYSLPNESGHKGTGIGLNFVREIAALHGGRVAFECTEDGETRFSFEVAVDRVQSKG